MRKKLNLIRHTGSFIYQNKDNCQAEKSADQSLENQYPKVWIRLQICFCLFVFVFSFFFRTSVVSPVKDRLSPKRMIYL